MNLNEKIEDISKIIDEINEYDSGVGRLFLEGFGITLRVLKEVAEKGNRDEIDMSEQIEMVTTALGFPLEDLIMHVLETKFAGQDNAGGVGYDINKVVDEETLDFITSDVDTDDYEKFLEDNKVKENLDFLKAEL
jgi:hypothetical protein